MKNTEKSMRTAASGPMENDTSVEKKQHRAGSVLPCGIVFGSFAIPLALDGYLSAPVLALLGAGLSWVGVRQHRVAARQFGLLLQGAAAYIFLDSVWYPFVASPFVNWYFCGCFCLAVASFFLSYLYDRNRADLRKWETFFPAPLMICGVAWWYIGGLREVDTQLMPADVVNGIMLYSCASSILSALVARKLQWRRLEGMLLVQLPAMVFLTLCSLLNLVDSGHLFYRWGIAAWAFGFATQYRILYFYGGTWKKFLNDGYHLTTMWLLMFVLSREVSWYIKNVVGGTETWVLASWGLIPAGALLLLICFGKRRIWPVAQYPVLYLGAGGVLPVIGLAGWIFIACPVVGSSWPLPYIPLLNPLELTGILVTTTLVLWVTNRRPRGGSRCVFPEKPSLAVIALLFFLWISSVIGRAVHFYAGIPYFMASLYRSVIFQASLAAFWGTAALALTVFGTRRGSRAMWTGGVLLLVMVIVKLFFVDLSNTGILARVVSLLVVGIVMLMVGYFSPLPPRHEEHFQ
ncbi:MAG: DUF2339 domain-containing protein [Desulforhopalus sp.]